MGRQQLYHIQYSTNSLALNIHDLPQTLTYEWLASSSTIVAAYHHHYHSLQGITTVG